MKRIPTQREIKNRFTYLEDKSTSHLCWRFNRQGGYYADKIRSEKRVMFWLGQVFNHSDLVWIYHNDSIPDGYEVFHLDNNSMNDKINNLNIRKVVK